MEYRTLNMVALPDFENRSDPKAGHNSEPSVKELYIDALRSQAAAELAWSKLMVAYESKGAPWSAVINCAIAAGVTVDELKNKIGVAPSNLSRWVSGFTAPARMLQKRLVGEMTEAISEKVSKIRALEAAVHGR